MSHPSVVPSFARSFVRSARLRPALVAALPAALLLTACGKDGPTATRDPLVVTASLANVTEPAIFDATSTTPTLVRCGIQMRLVATGTGRSRFASGTIYRYAGANRSTPTDSLVLSPALLQQAFATPAILPDVPMLGSWTVDDTIPFAMRVVVRHRVDGSAADETLSVEAPCGPTPSAATPGPEITNLSTTLSPGDFEPGDTLVVRYDVSAPLGLWNVRIRVSGPCDMAGVGAKRFETSARAEFVFIVPRTCELGVPLQLEAIATDAAMRADTSRVATGLTLVDRVAPTLNGAQDVGFSMQPMLFTGDTVRLMVFAQDNLELRWITIAASETGPVDSIAVPPGAGFGNLVAVAVRDAWAGSTSLRLRAIDRAGNRSTAFVTSAPTYQFFPGTTRASTGVTLTGEVRQFAVDRQGRVHVMQSNERRIVTLARGTLATVATLSFDGANPVSLVATPSGDSLVVLQYNRRGFRLLDVRGATPTLGSEIVIQGLDASKGEVPGHFVVTARGTAFMIVATNFLADARAVELNLATGATTPLDLGVTGATLANGAFLRSGDGRTVLFASTTQSGMNVTSCVRRWTIESGAFDACRTVDGTLRALDRTASLIAAGPRLYDGSFATPRPIQLLAQGGSTFYPLAIAPDGGMVYAAYRGGLIRIRPSDGATLGLLRGTASTEGFALDNFQLSPDGRLAVLASSTIGSSTSRIVTMELP